MGIEGENGGLGGENKSKEHRDDGKLHVQPADRDLGTGEARP